MKFKAIKMVSNYFYNVQRNRTEWLLVEMLLGSNYSETGCEHYSKKKKMTPGPCEILLF